MLTVCYIPAREGNASTEEGLFEESLHAGSGVTSTHVRTIAHQYPEDTEAEMDCRPTLCDGILLRTMFLS